MAGYFTQADLQALWESSVDPLYAQPFLEAGDGGGLEAYSQAFAQQERVSQAINNTLQAMFILPSSAQTAEPSGGESYATVDVTFTRELAFHVPVILSRGLLVEEVVRDHGVDVGVDVPTGRRFVLSTTDVIDSGSIGPCTIEAMAELPGWGYNNPLPDSITKIYQPGAAQTNNLATVVSNPGMDTIYAAPEYSTFIPGHVNQYLVINSTVNDGRIRRIVGYEPPGYFPIEHGGAVKLAQDMTITLAPGTAFLVGEKVSDVVTDARGTLIHYDSVTGTSVVQRASGYFAMGGLLKGETSLAMSPFIDIPMVGMLTALYIGLPLGSWIPGEVVNQAGTGASGIFVRNDGAWSVVLPTSGTFTAGNAVTGVTSTVVLTPSNIGVDPSLVNETRTATWRILRWDTDLGFSVTNVESPVGGRLGMLDELGKERNIARGNGEVDARYRKRVSKLPDVVSPNAIRRACSKFFTPMGWTTEFREVGTVDFPGFFYDVPIQYAPQHSFAWDMDFSIRPADRFKVWLDYAEFRAFFLIGVPKNHLGEYGFAYDSHPTGFYDIGPLDNYYDGSPYLSGGLNQGLWADLYERKAGGVGFDFFEL